VSESGQDVVDDQRAHVRGVVETDLLRRIAEIREREARDPLAQALGPVGGQEAREGGGGECRRGLEELTPPLE